MGGRVKSFRNQSSDRCHRGVSKTIPLRPPPAAPQPQDYDSDADCDEDDYIQTLDVFHQQVPMFAELVANQGNYSDPEQGSQEIEDGEAFPRHTQHSGQRSRNYAQAEDEASEENS